MKRWPDLVLRLRVDYRKAAIAAQRQIFATLTAAAAAHNAHALEHVRNCDNCKRQIRAEVERGAVISEELRLAAGIATVLS